MLWREGCLAGARTDRMAERVRVCLHSAVVCVRVRVPVRVRVGVRVCVRVCVCVCSRFAHARDELW